MIKGQLQYLRRNLKHMDRLLQRVDGEAVFKPRDRKLLSTIRIVYEQQRWMYEQRSQQIENRIVNLYQPWIRPIIRGKGGKRVEFGPKLSVSLIDGAAFVDQFRWEAFNESGDLKGQVEAYRERHGVYPEVVITDGIYGPRRTAPG